MALLSVTANPWVEGHPAECAICYEAYREAARTRGPKLLWCGHSVCLACLRKMVYQDGNLSFVMCPFCRTVTVMPEGGPQALEDDEELLRCMSPSQGAKSWPSVAPQEEMDDGKGLPKASGPLPGRSALPPEFSYGPNSPVFTVSAFVPTQSRLAHSVMGIWGMVYLQDVQNTTMVVDLPSQVSFRDSAMPKCVENLRLGFAITIILLIVCVFFTLVFFK